MMGAFLDALGIAHENGLIQGVTRQARRREGRRGGRRARDASSRPTTCRLYLNTLLSQDPRRWQRCATCRPWRACRLDSG